MDVGCLAPWTSLSLDPRGEVRVCCQNQWLRLGNVAESSLAEIWNGPELARLRARLRDGDFRLGCDECRIPIERGHPGTAFLHNYDHLVPAPGAEPPWPVQLELALSNTCNLQCVMCNGELSSAIRSQREHRPAMVSPYGAAFFEELEEFLLRIESVNFMGGEPFLARESLAVMERLVDLGLRPQVSVTTNGTIWNDRIAELVALLGMEVAVSVDGRSDAVLERVRVGIDPTSFRANVERLRSAATAGGGRLRLLFSLLRANWMELGAVLQWGDDLDVDVGLNRVEHPLQHSLVHGPLADLEDAVVAMEADPVARSLGRNRAVWETQLSALRSVLDERRSSTSSVSIRPGRGPVRGGRGPAFRARIDADPNQIVLAAGWTGEEPLGLGLGELVGGSLWRLVDLLTSRLGRLLRSDVRQPDSTSGERHDFTFESSDGVVEVAARVTSQEDGSSIWVIELRQSDPPE